MSSISSNASLSTGSDVVSTPETDIKANSDVSGRTTPYLSDNVNKKLFESSGFAKVFKREGPAKYAKSIPYRCSPSPTLMRDFGQRRKTILNTFCLSPRKKFDEDDTYRLYQYTISQKAKTM